MKISYILLITVILLAGLVGCGPAPQYNLTISSTEGGSVAEPGEGTFTYDEGTVVNLTAEAEDGYRFVEWTINACKCHISDIDAASTSINMSGDYAIVANFEELPAYNLTVYSTGDGSVTTPGQGTFTYYAGTVVTLMASPATCSASCCGFLNWTGDAEAIANVNTPLTTVTMNSHYTIAANFKPFPPEGEPVDCLGGVASGRQTYSISTPNNPRMTQIVFDPLDVNKCAWQEVTVWAKDLGGNPIYQVIGEASTNSMLFPFTLSLIDGTETNGVWQGYWYNEDEYCLNYLVTINVTSASGTSTVGITIK